MIAIKILSKKSIPDFHRAIDQRFFRKKHSAIFFKKRIAIENTARVCCCHRGVRRAVCADVGNFSRSDRVFFTKNALRFFRQNRSAIFLFTSRSRLRLKKISGKTGTGFHLTTAPRFYRKREAAGVNVEKYRPHPHNTRGVDTPDGENPTPSPRTPPTEIVQIRVDTRTWMMYRRRSMAEGPSLRREHPFFLPCLLGYPPTGNR